MGLVKLLDLKGTDDNPSFSKIAWWACFIACLASHQFSIFFAVLFGAWAFGRSAFMSYLATRPVGLSAAVSGNVKEIFGRRDEKAGIEPTP